MGLGSAMAGGNPHDERRDRDHYPTPIDVTKALLVSEWILGPVLEPACGDGAMARVFEEAGYDVTASDIQPLGYGVEQDFFQITAIDPDTNIITNPPFNLAERFIDHALSLKPQKLALVLKSSYWHAKSRLKLFERTKPAVIYPLTWRPDFLDKGRPTMEVCWTVWRRDHTGPTLYQPLSKP